MSEGAGEFFDLSVKPIFRDTFCSAEMRLEKAQDRLSIIDTVSRAGTSLRTSAAAATSVTVNVLRSVSI